MYRRYVWNRTRDALLAKLAAEGADFEAILKQLTDARQVATPRAVRRRMAVLGIRHARAGMWTADRDARLAALWLARPRLSLEAVAGQLDFPVSRAAVSRRARQLCLPPRYASIDPKCVEVRSPFAGERFHAALETPAPRARPVLLETPCPFIEASGAVCGVMVDRRPDGLGVRPSQYCPLHRARVLPISRGTIGTLATFARGVRYE